MSRSSPKTRGAGLIEVLVGAAVIAAILLGVVSVFNFFLKSGVKTTTKLQAGFLVEEGIEAARSLRDRSWSEFSDLSGGTHHLAFDTFWQATSSEQLIDGTFMRTVTISDAYRRVSDNDIVPFESPDPKTADSNTKKVTVSVSWGSLDETYVSFEDGTTNNDLASFPSNGAGDGNPVQGFTTGAEAVEINEVELLLSRASGTTPSDVYLEVRSTSPVGAVLGTSGAVAASSWGVDLSWIPFSFGDPIALSANTTYYLRLRSTPPSTEAFSGSSGTVHWGYKQSASSPYPGGSAYRYVGRQGNEADEGQVLTQYDFAFRAAYDGSGDSVEATTYLTNLFE